MNTPERAPLDFPCEFPIKAMGLTSANIEALVFEVANRHSADRSPSMRVRSSRGGKYVSVTVTVQATSREQLDAIYRELSACEQILVVL